MSYCSSCGNKHSERDLFCPACGTKLEQVAGTGEKPSVVSTEQQTVKSKCCTRERVANWAIISALVGAVCAVAALALTTVGLYQQYEFARNADWLRGSGGGLPPVSLVAGTALGAASTIFIAVAIALGICAMRSAKEATGICNSRT